MSGMAQSRNYSKARPPRQTPKPSTTSWQPVAGWYNKQVGKEGHYYHEHVVLPGVVRLLSVTPTSRVLDLGCGNGVLATHLSKVAEFVGVDSSPQLIEYAQKQSCQLLANWLIQDAARPLPQFAAHHFTHVAIILALQNMKEPEQVITNAADCLDANGKLVIVLNHPSFRIPRQSGWGIDEKNKQQYRWVNRYLSPLEVPIDMHPGRTSGAVTWSFHRPLQEYVQMLTSSGFVITHLEEWSSDKESVGTAARMENRARSEFPLFMAIVAEKTQT